MGVVQKELICPREGEIPPFYLPTAAFYVDGRAPVWYSICKGEWFPRIVEGLNMTALRVDFETREYDDEFDVWSRPLGVEMDDSGVYDEDGTVSRAYVLGLD